MVLNCSLPEPSSDDLLNNNHGSGTIDVQWILQDHRQLFSEDLSMALESEPIRVTKLNTAPTHQLNDINMTSATKDSRYAGET